MLINYLFPTKTHKLKSYKLAIFTFIVRKKFFLYLFYITMFLNVSLYIKVGSIGACKREYYMKYVRIYIVLHKPDVFYDAIHENETSWKGQISWKLIQFLSLNILQAIMWPINFLYDFINIFGRINFKWKY